MPDWFDEWTDPTVVIALSTFIILAVGALLSVLFWVIRREVGEVRSQVFPNGGSSMRDSINRIEKKLDGHIIWHLDNKE